MYQIMIRESYLRGEVLNLKGEEDGDVDKI